MLSFGDALDLNSKGAEGLVRQPGAAVSGAAQNALTPLLGALVFLAGTGERSI